MFNDIIFHEFEVWVALSLSIIPFIISLFFVKRSNYAVALTLLIVSGFMLRLSVISFDPYLHEWDERFHAVVAKNMMEDPFKPMLRKHPLLPYQPEHWQDNHVWVHKQPLFLWQMAGSMKLIGVNGFGLRLPSALMGTIAIFFVFQIANALTKSKLAAFTAAALYTFSYYSIEMTSGRIPLDHNDLAFGFYITASVWAFTRYPESNKKWKWAFIIGVFCGAAILIKWLTALLIFGGWGLYLLQDRELRNNLQSWLHIGAALLTCGLIFVPWQIYILHEFPVESAATFSHNKRHFIEVLDGHPGSWYYHLSYIPNIYGIAGTFLLLTGGFLLFRSHSSNKKMLWSFIAMILVLYGFFTLAKTKMPSFTYPVHAILWSFIGYGLYKTTDFVRSTINFFKHLTIPFILTIAIFTLSPWDIAKHRRASNTKRENRIHNHLVYKSKEVTELAQQDYVLLHCNLYEHLDLMFFQDCISYPLPSKERFKILVEKCVKIAAFKTRNGQSLPHYVQNEEKVYIIDVALK